MPRIAAIEYPLGRTFGQPGDSHGQMAVLRAALHALQTLNAPGGIQHLPFEWPEPPREVRNRVAEAPPIVGYLMRHPWAVPRLFRREIPD